MASFLHVICTFSRNVDFLLNSIGIIGLAFNLRAYDFISQELKAAEDPLFNIKCVLIMLAAYLFYVAQDLLTFY